MIIMFIRPNNRIEGPLNKSQGTLINATIIMGPWYVQVLGFDHVCFVDVRVDIKVTTSTRLVSCC